MNTSILAILLFLIFAQAGNSQAIIDIDSTKRYQVIDGWEAVGNSMEATSVRDTLMPYLAELINLAVNDVGITRLRFSFKSGMEDSVDYFTKVLDGEITYDEFKLHRYSKINDNDNPNSFNPAGFKLSGLDHNVQNLVLPFKKAVEENGDRFYYNMCYVDFVDQSEFNHRENPEEYAEFVSYAWKYLDSVYGVTPDGLEIILEPDNAEGWHHDHLPEIIAAAGDRLKSLGYRPEFIAPSVLNLRSVPKYFKAISENPKALSYLDVLSYHRYSGNNDTAAQNEIVKIAEENNLKTAMLEYDKNGDVNELHYDLAHNNVTAWTKYALMYKSDERFAYVYVDATEEGAPEFGICKQTKYLRQYFKFIRPGAQRIEAVSSSELVEPVAFENLSGRHVAVLKTETGGEGEIIINGLPPGEYGIKYTLGNYDWASVGPKAYDIDLPNQALNPGQAISFIMPEKGVATVYGISGATASTAGEEKYSQIEAYPNPANTHINIRNAAGAPQEYLIISALGQIALRGQINAENSRIGLTSLAPGIYILKIGDEAIQIIKAE